MFEPLTRYAQLANVSDAARQYAIRSLTEPGYLNLSTDAALAIARSAEQEQSSLTVAEAMEDVEMYWQRQTRNGA